MKNLRNKTIIIFGSKGKIGSEILDKISDYNCKIIACDNSFIKPLKKFT